MSNSTPIVAAMRAMNDDTLARRQSDMLGRLYRLREDGTDQRIVDAALAVCVLYDREVARRVTARHASARILMDMQAQLAEHFGDQFGNGNKHGYTSTVEVGR
jgi:hypothetical protein